MLFILPVLITVFGLSQYRVHAATKASRKAEEGKPTLGIVHITFEPTFLYQNIHYQSFDRSYREHWIRLSEEKGFNLVQVEGGATSDSGSAAVRRLIDLGVDAILYFQHDPEVAIQPVKIAGEAGVPIAIHGLRPAKEVQVSYVGFAEYETCTMLGKETARLFQKRFPDKQANLLIINSRTVPSDVLREQGFIHGFREIIPDARVVARPQDNGTVEAAVNNVHALLLRYPEINTIYNTSDARAMGTMQALRRLGRGTPETELVAGVGGSAFAMEELLDDTSSWQAEVGLAIKDAAEKSYQVLHRMLKGDVTGGEHKEVLVTSPVFVNSSREDVEEYLHVNHGIEKVHP
jgi:ABC-type sugar transport system substrate-binding protein